MKVVILQLGKVIVDILVEVAKTILLKLKFQFNNKIYFSLILKKQNFRNGILLFYIRNIYI